MFHKILNIKLSLLSVVLIVMLTSAHGVIKLKDYQLQESLQKLEQYKQVSDKVLGVDLSNLSSIKVTVTSYNPVPAQTDNTPLYGSDGELVVPGILAVSKDLRKKYHLKDGDKVILENYGTFLVKDSMHPRWKNRVDIISFSKKWSKKFGTKKNVTLYFNKEK